MSKKTEILVVGALSIALFTGFTGYSHFIGKIKPISVPEKSSVSSSTPVQTPTGKNLTTQPSVLAQNPADSQAELPPDSAPPETARKKNTKTKAS